MPLSFCFKDCVQLNFQSSTLCVSDNSSQSFGFPHLRRYSCPPSTAHDPQEQNLKSCTVQLSITSLHFLHRIIFLTIFIMHVTRSQLSESSYVEYPFLTFFESPAGGYSILLRVSRLKCTHGLDTLRRVLCQPIRRSKVKYVFD